MQSQEKVKILTQSDESSYSEDYSPKNAIYSGALLTSIYTQISSLVK
jgi:hypothetical protein